MFISESAAMALVSEIKELTGSNINIMDETGVIFASTDLERIGQRHTGAYRLLKDGMTSLSVQRDAPEHGERRGINLPICLNGQTLGVIGITGAPEEVSALGGIIQRMTEISVHDASRQEHEAVLEQARQCFIENWLFSAEADISELELRGKMLGIDITLPWTVVILQVRETKPDLEMRNAMFLKHIRPYMNQGLTCRYAVINQRILLLFQSSDRHEVLAKARQILEELEHSFSTSVCGGVSSGIHRRLDIRRSYSEARSACRAALNSDRSLLAHDETSLEFLTDCIPADVRSDLAAMVFPDGCDEAELRETVLLYFKHHGDTQKMAEAMFLHRNTVQYRLQKIKSQTGYSIRNPEDSVLLYLACLHKPDR